MVEGHAAENFDVFGWHVKLLLQVSLRDVFLELYVRLESYPATLVFRQAPHLETIHHPPLLMTGF